VKIIVNWKNATFLHKLTTIRSIARPLHHRSSNSNHNQNKQEVSPCADKPLLEYIRFLPLSLFQLQAALKAAISWRGDVSGKRHCPYLHLPASIARSHPAAILTPTVLKSPPSQSLCHWLPYNVGRPKVPRMEVVVTAITAPREDCPRRCLRDPRPPVRSNGNSSLATQLVAMRAAL
jgi:hypothetical protein